MQIVIDTGHNVEGSEDFSAHIEAGVKSALLHYTEKLTRVEVHLSDKNAAKSGSDDKRCLIEARPAGLEPVTVTNDAATVQAAFDGAAKKMSHLLETTFGKLNHHKGGASIKMATRSD